MNSVSRQDDNTETAGTHVRPPLLFLATLLLGFVLDHLLPVPASAIGAAHWTGAVGGFLILIGIAVFAAGIRSFFSADTPVQGTKPTRTLVTTGIYARSRNPIYVGMFLVYAGIGLVARSPWVLILTLPIAITMRYLVVAREEAYLNRLFGDAYRQYKARVRRWL
jgi:protein-S-isoprenylcysteine O-methyltransferase Ste14